MQLVKANSTSIITLSNTKTLFKYIKNKTAVKTLFAGSLLKVMAMYQDADKETAAILTEVMIDDYDPVSVPANVIKSLFEGKTKVFGRITPDLLNTLLIQERTKITIEKENQNAEYKGYNTSSAEKRTSGRLSDYFEGK